MPICQKAPACEKCNGEKSRAEHYLTAVLPIAGRHAKARTNRKPTAERLAKNRPLARHLRTASQPAWIRQDERDYASQRGSCSSTARASTAPEVCRKRPRMPHHWKVYLRARDAVVVLLFPDASSELFHQLICGMRPGARGSEDFGNGTLRYRGVQAAEPPQLTLWTMSLYGGIVLSDDGSRSTGESISCTTWWVITGPKELAETFARRTSTSHVTSGSRCASYIPSTFPSPSEFQSRPFSWKVWNWRRLGNPGARQNPSLMMWCFSSQGGRQLIQEI